MGGSEAAASAAQQPTAGPARQAWSLRDRPGAWAVAAPFLAVLAGLVGQLTVGRAIVWTADSFGFVYPGMLMASGADAVGQLSGRNIGYPWLAALVLPLGGLRALVTVQSLAAAGGLSALLLCLRAALRNPYLFCAAGLLMVLAAYGSDSFVIYAQTINGDSLFGSLLALSLWLFLTAWGRNGATGAGFMIAAAAASYAAYLIKPNGVLTIGVCVAGLAVIGWRQPRLLLRPGNLALLAAFALVVVVAQTQQARLTQKGVDFGPRVLFCGHLDIVGPDLGSATPERRALSKLLDDVRNGPRWTAIGYDPDLCFYSTPVTSAIHAAAAAEGMSDGAWMARRVAQSTLRHPAAYVSGVAHQVAFFLRHPNIDADLASPSRMSDWDWTRMTPYAPLIRAPRIELDRQTFSWVAQRHAGLASLGKHTVGLIVRSLLPMALISLGLAAWLVGRRRRIDGPLELAFLAASAFLAAAVLSVALSFTFDISRYAASFAILTYLWWFLALSYLLAASRRALGITGSPVSVRFRLAADGLEFAARWPEVRRPELHLKKALGGARRGAEAVAARWRACSPCISRVAMAAPFAAILLYLSLQLVLGLRVLWGADSAGFAYTGMMLASGDDITGNLGGRNIGYTLFSAPLLRLGGFPALVIGQAVLASVGLAGLVLALRQIVRPALLFGCAALLFVLTVLSSDSFVIYVQTVNGEALFGAALSVAMVLFVMAWRRQGAARAGLLLGALAAAYVTWLVKPNAVLTIPLCGAAFLGMALLDRRAVLKPALLIGLAALAVFVGATYAFQSKAQPKAYDFGTRVLYCGHIDVVLPELGAAPQQRQLAVLLDAARHAPPLGWVAMGYNADRCFYSQPVFDAIHAAASAEGLTDKAWMAKEFRNGVLHHPFVYAGGIWRQVVQYFRHPAPEADVTMYSRMPDDGWAQLQKYSRLIRLPQSAFDVDARSWFALSHPTLARIGKTVIGVISNSLAWSTAAAVLAALGSLFVRWRRKQDLAPELVVLASSAFMMAVILTTAISFTFDVGRYASSVAPPAFAWWLCCVAYLALMLWRTAAAAWKQRRRPAAAPV